MPYKIRQSGKHKFKVTTPNHPHGFSKHGLTKKMARKQLFAIRHSMGESRAAAILEALVEEARKANDYGSFCLKCGLPFAGMSHEKFCHKCTLNTCALIV
jgi:hypothetical protein